MFICILYWNRPTSIVRRHRKARLIIAIILALIQIAFWITMGIFVIYKARKGVFNNVPR